MAIARNYFIVPQTNAGSLSVEGVPGDSALNSKATGCEWWRGYLVTPNFNKEQTDTNDKGEIKQIHEKEHCTRKGNTNDILISILRKQVILC